MATLSFQADSTWRKIGFALHSDSLAYRKILEDNPQWSVMQNPPVGASLRSRSAAVSSTGISQQSPVVSMGADGSSFVYYPFDSRQDYLQSLVRYSPASLMDVERLNGWSQNSTTSDSPNNP
jgi:hypothetical protein